MPADDEVRQSIILTLAAADAAQVAHRIQEASGHVARLQKLLVEAKVERDRVMLILREINERIKE